MGDNNQVKLFGFWYSPFSVKFEIALWIKGVKYEYVEEDRDNKSEELIKYNPIYKKIPVLVHNGKHMAESQVIIEYIDETWKDNPILPVDPYQRAQARFWAKFIDDKIVGLRRVLFKLMPSVRGALTTEGEEGEKLRVEAEELLKIFENELNGKKFLGGNGFGYLDLVGIAIAQWAPAIQGATGKELITKEKHPNIWAWADRLLGCNVIQEKVPPREKLAQLFRARFAKAAALAK